MRYCRTHCTPNDQTDPGRAVQWRNRLFTPALEKARGVHILHWGLLTSQVPPTMHIGGHDCTHYCMPGFPDDQAQIVMNYLVEGGL